MPFSYLSFALKKLYTCGFICLWFLAMNYIVKNEGYSINSLIDICI